ncbi:S-adenosylmethionine:tRNA ribosyltransferase-isomerase [Ferdinandcohnia quinoae]|uniref:S-adenosylmethionine:tRNA ribosyltransferase-isomerase n=1 Tax=Fredinandcohnia quinoae TaxID=2918902 RepID=A0AAW5E5B8_9BACI|nr:S-adenosylmethionine:tRNA ribosyltransferase-isomerase [Fredinandcohnia sp. SECRCQ15]MCH1626044.1 S-adenosylmethionine:tRNA ribosyltransferase-isomerase [Fredinandcohnia sp. SECRCQ15]
MVTEALDFYLPNELNASSPPEKRGLRRDHVRLMVLNRASGESRHDRFFHLSNYLNPGDLIILNNSRTIPAVLYAKWFRNHILITSKVEVRLARMHREENTWDALIVPTTAEIGDTLYFSSELSATVINEKGDSPLRRIRFTKNGSEFFNLIYSLGEPVRYEYINHPWDLDYYQTVFASHPGSVEMPSAGRAFSWELLFQLKSKNIQHEYIQLHTGLSYLLDDSWNPTPEENKEEYQVSEQTMKRILETKASGHRVIAVGTTVVRALESVANSKKLSGVTNLYITKHYPLKIVDGILTGFHEPKASHLDMLTAFVSEHHLLHAYDQAIKNRYLWHEFGDMNLII